MSKITVKLTEELQKKLKQLAGPQSDEIARKGLRAGAGIMANQVRANLKKNLAGSPHSTGKLLDSLGISAPQHDKNGVLNVKIGFSGYDSSGVPNVLKARAMESGTSKQPKKPFVRPAFTKTKKAAEQEMSKVIFDEIEKVLGGK